MRKGIAAALGMLCLLSSSTAQEPLVEVQGRVLGPDGKPVANAIVSKSWYFDEKAGEQTTNGGSTTDADGRFDLKVYSFGRHFALMAFDGSMRLGGLAVLNPEGPSGPLEIRLAPTARLHAQLVCKEMGVSPKWTNVYVDLGPDVVESLNPGTQEREKLLTKADPTLRKSPLRVLANSSLKAEFSAILPPGDYRLQGYGQDARNTYKTVVIRADQPDLDLGSFNLRATVTGLHKGKAPPAWSIADARNVEKDVTLADFRGKWVFLEFWGSWCGPCVRRLAESMEFYDDHATDRDKFEIIALHDGTVKDFAEMDAKLVKVKQDLWHDRDLPFPVLLDAQNGDHGATVDTYDIQMFPTTVLIDPEGRMVGEATLETLAEKLPPLPIAKRIARALERTEWLEVDSTPLNESIASLSEFTKIPIMLDADSLKAVGVEAGVVVPLKLSGFLSLRSWLELVLDPYGLEAKPSDEGLVIVKAASDPDRREPSAVQKDSAARIAEVLAKPASFDFKNGTLEEVAQHFEKQTGENFVLDPGARKTELIDPEAVVTGSSKDAPLGKALTDLLKPSGLKWVVRDEVVLITK